MIARVAELIGRGFGRYKYELKIWNIVKKCWFISSWAPLRSVGTCASSYHIVSSSFVQMLTVKRAKEKRHRHDQKSENCIVFQL